MSDKILRMPEKMVFLTPPSEVTWPSDQHYVWPYQPHFAVDVRCAADGLFRELDDRLRPDAFVVAVRHDRGDTSPQIVVEPFEHVVKPSLYEGVMALVDSSYTVSPATSFGYHKDDPHGENWARRKEREEYLSRIGSSIQRITSSSFNDDAQLVYVSVAREVGPYAVFVVLMLPKRIVDAHPHLNIVHRDDIQFRTSLTDATATSFMRACWRALPQSLVGDDFATFPTKAEILKHAGELLMHSATYPCDNLSGLHGAFEVCNTIATLTYERSDSKGVIVLSRKHHLSVDQRLALKDPVEINSFRAVRKLLQLPGPDEALLCDSSNVYGVGRISPRYDASREDVFAIEFIANAKWQLAHAGVPLMLVEYGVPRLPSSLRKTEQFVETFRRRFSNSRPENIKIVTQIATAATNLRHGTIIVIASDAEEEADRFGGQAIRIAPSPVTEELLNMASRIDGAILVSPDGVCHAIGVILDGDATPRGTSERGARYNSALRYVYGRRVACVAMVVSDDGMIDCVPTYRPKTSRCEIEQRLDGLRTCVGEDVVSQAMMNKQLKWLDEHRFYLSADQCEEINGLTKQAKAKLDSSAWRVSYSEFKPHPDMDESFLT